MSRITNDTIITVDHTPQSGQAGAQPLRHDVTPGTHMPVTPPHMSAGKEMQLRQLGQPMASGRHITAEMLETQKSDLKITSVATVPHAQNLAILRTLPKQSQNGEVAPTPSKKEDYPQNGAQMADFIADTRQHLTRLATTNSGQELLHALDKNMFGMPIPHKVAIQDPCLQQGIKATSTTFDALNASFQPQAANQIMPGYGSISLIDYQTDIMQRAGDGKHTGGTPLKVKEEVPFPPEVALGHELIHAVHNSQGLRESRNRIDGLSGEEANTVGLPTGERIFAHIPTENNLRADLDRQYYQDPEQNGGQLGPIPPRPKYSGKTV
ncbi:M91 family zinc metallopeptidase [Vibrio mangrovi]|uniref:M91 family zinc metallopeptidase n=1 Tax=Vibrio mangrovi TaxID=474394 RepID=A0A1Y6IZ64_9VIBR|nr:M91 family zinc metallopeptidase [Vibrio mangrovi]MDW6005430.1 M91 family zinc metallopeptidase [Vibrio mangrovi]SMS02130.1 hypothetical protein VIM7927_03448 [Vibrio mangrovi]